MSGLNPFRLSRKPDALPVTTPFVDDSLFAPPGAPVHGNEKNGGNEDQKAFDALDNENQNPAAATHTATTTASTMAMESTRDIDTTSVSSDDGQTSDPFRQASHLSDNDGDGGNYKETRRDSAVQPDGLSSAPPTSADTSTKESSTLHPKSAKRASRPLPPPPTGSRTANSSSTDVSQLSTRSGTVNKRTSVTDIDARSLGSRSGNREKKPPPPPKSHHGKLINNPAQPVPAESKRFSFHDSSSETSFYTPSTPSQSSKPSVQVDYFSTIPNESQSQNQNQNSNARATDTLKRSQSQYKRPPTPPLSRRHSQMKRSKSTLSSKQNQNRLSLPVGSEGVKPSPPPSPGTTTTSLNPPVQRASRPLSLQTDDNTLKSILSLKEQAPSPLSPAAESPLSRTTSIRRTASGSSSTAAPPPPPPRRARYSNDSTRPVSYMQSKKTEEESTFQPSNANNILEDLSRLQKEVDDLRGRYESRQGSH